jgi:DNA (cytosine-5)-methyltransferase 1
MMSKYRAPEVRLYLQPNEIIVDSFAGGGGASSGLADAIGVEPFIAINHNAEAIAMHRANHPNTKHYIEDVWQVDPVKACEGRPVALAWFSPDCKHFSKARGGKPRSQRIRGLAWVAVKWARLVRPRVICIENVEELTTWGPLHQKHSKTCSKRGRMRRLRAHRVDCKRRKKSPNPDFHGCGAGCHYHQPIKARSGETWKLFLSKLAQLGYVVEWKLLRACDYGAPTSRRRLFLVARCDGRPIVWPEATHGPNAALPYRTAAECIDWSINCPSIFSRKRPLKDKTLARIARGIRKFVISSAKPFIVPLTHPDPRVHNLDEPIVTITGANRGELAIVTPTLVRTAHGDVDRTGKRRGRGEQDIVLPLPTVTGSHDFALVSPTLIKAKTYGGGGNSARPANEPIGAITGSKRGEHAIATAQLVRREVADLAVAHLSKLYGTATGADVDAPSPTITGSGEHLAPVVAHLMRYNGQRREGEVRGAPVESPLPTQDTSNRFAIVAAFLARYNGQSTGQVMDAPIGTVDTTDRYSLVTVMIEGEEYAIVDIGMRMLSPRELFACQGFAPDYIINPVGPSGKRLTKTAQIRMVGNSVPPPAVAAIARAQLYAPTGVPRNNNEQLDLFRGAA